VVGDPPKSSVNRSCSKSASAKNFTSCKSSLERSFEKARMRLYTQYSVGRHLAPSRRLPDQALEEDTKLQYRLEIHRPGSCDDQECLKIFTSTAPFLPLRIGDLLNTSAWDRDASGWKLLRVLNVEHVISEKPSESTLLAESFTGP